MKKRFLSVLLVVCMMLTMLPVSVWAAEASGTEDLPVTADSGKPNKTGEDHHDIELQENLSAELLEKYRHSE